MKQNIYDEAAFFEGYRKLREQPDNANALMDLPTIASLLPSLEGKRVLDLGCGFGDFCRYAAEQGAASILGVDISENMLKAAQAQTSEGTPIIYERAAMEDVTFNEGQFDIAVSGLALHYTADLAAMARKIFAALIPGGCYVFSVEHPMRVWVDDLQEGYQIGTLDLVKPYFDEGIREETWFVDKVQRYHRTVETYVNTFLDAGFQIVRMAEGRISDEMLADHPRYIVAKQCPFFLTLRVDKPAVNKAENIDFSKETPLSKWKKR